MEDIFGREFKTGDIVIYPIIANRLAVATVSKVCAKKLRLQRLGSSFSFVKDPSACVIVDGKHVEAHVLGRLLSED